MAGVLGLFLGKDLFSWVPKTSGESTPSAGFRINSVARWPVFDPGSWNLRVDGLVRNPLRFDFEEFTNLPQVEFVNDFHCVEGWGAWDVTWKGVALSELMDRAEIDPQATHLIFHSGDDANYTDSVTIEEARRPDTMLAHELNGELLQAEMGRPLRLVLPNNFGYKYVKWVIRVEAVALGPEGYKGYWEQRGYPADATIG